MQLVIVLCWKMFEVGCICVIWCLAAVSHCAAFGWIFPSENTPTIARFQPLNTTFEDCSDSWMDLVMLLDSSTSIGTENFRRLKTLMTEVATSSSIDDGKVRVAVVTFSTSSTVEFFLDDFTSKTDVQKEIEDIAYRKGFTNIASGFSLVKDGVFQWYKGDRIDVRNVLLLIVDGPSNRNSSLTIPTATLVKESGVHVFVLGIEKADVDEITGIASDPTDINCMKGQFDDLERIKEYLFKTMCTGVARAEAMSSSVTTRASTTRGMSTSEVTTTTDTTSTDTTMPVTSMTSATSPRASETPFSSTSTTSTTARSTSVTSTEAKSMSMTRAGQTAKDAASFVTTTEDTGNTTPVTSANKDTTATSFFTPPTGSTTAATSMIAISSTGATTTTPTDTTTLVTTTSSSPTTGLAADGSPTTGLKPPNACYRLCDQAAANTPENTDDFLKELQLPKRELSKQIGERTSTSNLSKSEMMTGMGVSIVLLAPFAFLVGWDILDFIRYIDKRCRRKGVGLY